MNFQRQITLLLIMLITSGIAFGQGAAKVGSSEVDGSSRLDELRRQGYEALYNLNYEEARRRFKEIVRLFPDHPAGPQCLAASLWLQQLNQSRRLQASLYKAESFYARNEGKADPRTVDQFRQWTKEATLLAEARLRLNPRDVEALYFLGATEGLKSVFAAAAERRFVAALRDGSRAVDRHRAVLKLDPNFHDAELTVGMYDYILGWLPLPVKVLASITGARGSKKRGLATIERVAREGRWARDIARVLLIDLYKREKRWMEASAVSRELATRYPRNHLFKLQLADALMSQAATLRQTKDAPASAAGSAEEREAFQIFESLLQDRATRNADTTHAPDLIHFRYAEALLVARQPEQATKEFLTAASVGGVEPGFMTIATLRAAQSMDLAGRRSEALVQYRAVLERPNIYDAHEKARRGLREPYRNLSHVQNER